MSFDKWLDEWKKLMKYNGVSMSQSELEKNISSVRELWLGDVPEFPFQNWENVHNISWGRTHRGNPENDVADGIAKFLVEVGASITGDQGPVLVCGGTDEFSMAKPKKVRADVVGAISIKQQEYIYVGELKAISDQRAWWATVENLLQLKVFNSKYDEFLNVFRDRFGLDSVERFRPRRHAIGLVMAEGKVYFSHNKGKSPQSYEYANVLLDRLDVPVGLGFWEKGEDGKPTFAFIRPFRNLI